MKYKNVLMGKLYKAINQSIIKFLLDREYMMKTKHQKFIGIKKYTNFKVES